MRFEILDMEDDGDDNVTLSIDYDQEFGAVVSKYYKKEHITSQDVQKYLFEVLATFPEFFAAAN